MDTLAITYLICLILGVLLLWKMRVFSNLIEAYKYIREHGWAEYKEARRRYDKYNRKEQLALPSKSETREFQKQLRKQQKMRK